MCFLCQAQRKDPNQLTRFWVGWGFGEKTSIVSARVGVDLTRRSSLDIQTPHHHQPHQSQTPACSIILQPPHHPPSKHPFQSQSFPLPFSVIHHHVVSVHVISDHHIISLVSLCPLLFRTPFLRINSIYIYGYIYTRSIAPYQMRQDGKMILEMVVKSEHQRGWGWGENERSVEWLGRYSWTKQEASAERWQQFVVWSGIKLRDSVCVYVDWCGLDDICIYIISCCET